jgi:hypothetical protein
VEKDFRALISGETGQGEAIVAINGIGVPGDVSIDLPWGTLRAPNATERETNPFTPDRPTGILAIPFDAKYQLGDPVPDAPLNEDVAEIQGFVTEKSEQAILTLLLAVRRDQPTTGNVLWTSYELVGQLGHGHFGSAMPSNPFAPSTGLEEADIEAVQLWANRVDEHFHPSIAVGVRRTLRAIRERRDPHDALIDAVIAWENLFGGGLNTELTFRVSAAITLLLEDIPARRPTLRKELAKTYELRSKVVHGSELTMKDKLDERRIRAIEVAVECFRRLFEARSDLLPNRERGSALLLDL